MQFGVNELTEATCKWFQVRRWSDDTAGRSDGGWSLQWVWCLIDSRLPSQSSPISTDSTLARLHMQSTFHHRSLVPLPAICWDNTSPMMSSPCQPAATYIKREVMQLPSNGVDDNRSSDDSWTYVYPDNSATVNFFTRDDRAYALCHVLAIERLIKLYFR